MLFVEDLTAVFDGFTAVDIPVQGGNTEQLGWVLYTDYLIPFELASILLLVAMVGAIVLAKRSLD